MNIFSMLNILALIVVSHYGSKSFRAKFLNKNILCLFSNCFTLFPVHWRDHFKRIFWSPKKGNLWVQNLLDTKMKKKVYNYHPGGDENVLRCLSMTTINPWFKKLFNINLRLFLIRHGLGAIHKRCPAKIGIFRPPFPVCPV